MFDIGFGELLLVAVVALVVLGPERLPGAARTLGALLRRAREGWNSVRSEVERELQTDELRRHMKDAAQAVHQTGDVMRETVRNATDSVREMSESVRDTPAHADAGEASTAYGEAAAKPDAHDAPGAATTEIREERHE